MVDILIDDVVNLLGLEKEPRRGSPDSYNVKCPWCDASSKKYHMNINTVKNAYRCVKCATGGYALDLYGRVRMDTPLVKGNGRELYASLSRELTGEAPAAEYRVVTKAEEPKGIFPANDDKLDG